MFAITKSERPDRCELCKHAVTVTVSVDRGFFPMTGPGEYSTSWADRYATEERRQCKRFPPTPNEHGWGASPYVRDGGYCGEFTAKPCDTGTNNGE